MSANSFPNVSKDAAGVHDQIASAVLVVAAVAEVVRQVGSIPSGNVYANLCGMITLPQYESILTTLKNAELISESPAHLLTWIGPDIPLAPPPVARTSNA